LFLLRFEFSYTKYACPDPNGDEIIGNYNWEYETIEFVYLCIYTCVRARAHTNVYMDLKS